MNKQDEKLKQLQETIGYHFQNPELLKHALIHSSYINEHHMKRFENNERLEFLGDAVLELASSDFLYRNFPEKPEGELTKTRASIVCEPTLAFCARAIGLGDYLYLGKGEESEGGRNRDSITSDALEAVIGAIYLDSGFANAKEFINKFIMNDLEHKKLFYDSKTILQEIVQGRTSAPLSYELVKEEGPDHRKTFYVNVLISGQPVAEGQGRTKKSAEQMAAYHAILKLKEKER